MVAMELSTCENYEAKHDGAFTSQEKAIDFKTWP